MIVLRTPKGWTGPKRVDGKPVEGTWRSHQVPLAELAKNPAHLGLLESWMRSYRPEELFDAAGRLQPELAELAPRGARRMGANPHANGGAAAARPAPARFPRNTPSTSPEPGARPTPRPRACSGTFLRDVMASNAASRATSASLGPDETSSNRLGAVFEVTDRGWMADIDRGDDHLSPDGRVMEILSEHTCQGWLEGYLLTGRHGFFPCYEAFIHVVDSMFNQHAKWLKTTRNEIPWRRPIASLNYLLTSHVWRQDHNGFTHQDPGFIDLVVNKKAEVIRVYLPPDANTLLSVTDHCLRSRHYVNVIVAGKQPGAAVARHGARRSGTARPASASGSGRATTAAQSPTSSWPAPATCRRSRRWPPSRSCASTSPSSGARRQRGRPHGAAAAERASARPVRQGVRLAVHHRQADRLRLPRLSVADPPADLPADQPPQPPRPRLQGGGHHDHAVRHGRCATTSTASIWSCDVIDRVPGSGRARPT